MNYFKKFNIKTCLYIVIASSILICLGISLIYIKQKESIKQEIKISENIRQARIDLTKGFLHLALAGNSRSPFKQEIGIAYINQSVKAYNQSLSFENKSTRSTITENDKLFLKSFIINITNFQESLNIYNTKKTSDPKLETNLRIQFYSIEKQADQIDTLIKLNIDRFSSNLNTVFLIALVIAVLLLTLICIIFFNLIIEINNSNKELSDSQKQLKSISDNLVNGMIYQVTLLNEKERTFSYVSNSVKTLYGYSPEEVINNSALIYSKIHPNDLEEFLLAEQVALNSKSTFKKEARVINPDGTIRWSYYVSHPHFSDGIIYWDGIEIDITDKKQMEIDLQTSKKQIEDSEEKYRIATEATKDGIWEWNLETNETNFSKRWHEILGFEGYNNGVRLTYEDWESRIHPKDKNYVLKALKDHIETGIDYNVQYRHLHYSNKYRWQNAIGKAIFEKNGKPTRMIGSIRDIDKNKKAEKVLNEERDFLKNILESMSDAYVSIDKNWRFTNLNLKASEILGKIPADLIGKNIWEEFPNSVGKNFELCCRKAMKEKVSLQMEDYYPPLDKWIENNIFQTKTGISIFFSDISKRKKSEIELVKAKEKAEESDRLKTAFLANMSHEIRTPMNGILGFSSLLSEPGLGKQEQQEYIKLIQKSGARMLNLISEIIDISKIESGMMEIYMEEINVNEKLNFVYELLKLDAEEKSLQLNYIGNMFPNFIILTDSEKFYAILTNLVKNAIKYTDNGSVEFGYIIKNDCIEFFVKDTGIGIPKELHTSIFERFIQVDIENIQARQGAGLGLAITKAFVTLLGGEIWLESQEGKGSTFYFTLPINLEKKDKNNLKNKIQNNEKQKFKKINSKLKILITDDDTISRKLISKTVNEFGNEILEAKNGQEAVEILRHIQK